MSDKSDPMKDEKFKQVVRHFLDTPPQPHKKPDSDKPKGKGKKATSDEKEKLSRK